MNPKTKLDKKLIIAIIAATIALTLLVNYAASLLMQQASNENHGELPPQASLFVYHIDGILHEDGDLIEWGQLEYGKNNLTIRIQNIHTNAITVIFKNETMPIGWTITAEGNNTILPAYEPLYLNVTVTVPDTIVETSTNFYWATTLKATAVI